MNRIDKAEEQHGCKIRNIGKQPTRSMACDTWQPCEIRNYQRNSQAEQQEVARDSDKLVSGFDWQSVIAGRFQGPQIPE